MTFPLETARELALTAACSAWSAMNRPGELRLIDETAREFPWGWIFQAAPAEDDGKSQPFLRVSVDRFTGKTQILADGA